jgi:hypothetical protein
MEKVKEIELMGTKYEKAESLKYLWAMITSLSDIETEIKVKLLLVVSALCTGDKIEKKIDIPVN